VQAQLYPDFKFADLAFGIEETLTDWRSSPPQVWASHCSTHSVCPDRYVAGPPQPYPLHTPT
jgi:hypothetical protein